MKALVLFSGGLDSTTCLALAVEKYGKDAVLALSISYGQKHRKEIEAAQAGNDQARLAVDVFITGIVHYIGAFAMDLGGLDYLVFTAGIGEHSAYVRSRVCEKLGLLGVQLDEEKNRRNETDISAADSAVQVLVIPTNEELGIARRTYEYPESSR